ncbi:putative Serine-rich protein-related [Melia azedarach]|uniref:Serine-rich protein-related n=3 Tax=Melia azedarach TaxID=155640 RepID=A0ACC1YQB9_MELAZ|nr:putative Serine-rich protein-related [Melia azedarach]KAJ4725344.1 putative Serine-rich protein-related [Melia azedarach]KAJ4725373.1 putative Serine-rich protein-related [Melia azedarach]
MSLNKENRDEIQEQATPSATPRMNIDTKNPEMAEFSFTEFKSQSSFPGSPRSQKGIPKSSSARCLCSPTTHAGSFRCRHHRALGMSRAGSLGSNLSLLGTKSGQVAESKLNRSLFD